MDIYIKNIYIHVWNYIYIYIYIYIYPCIFAEAYSPSHNNSGPRSAFQRLLVPVHYRKTVENSETDPQLLWEYIMLDSWLVKKTRKSHATWSWSRCAQRGQHCVTLHCGCWERTWGHRRRRWRQRVFSRHFRVLQSRVVTSVVLHGIVICMRACVLSIARGSRIEREGMIRHYSRWKDWERGYD